jgi:hypothetical protein
MYYSSINFANPVLQELSEYLSEKNREGILEYQFDKRLESLLLAIHSPFYLHILRKPSSTLVLKIHTKNPQTSNSSLFMNSIL